MLRLKRVFKNYEEAGSLNAHVNLYGFIGPEVFLTKTGEVGVILEIRGVDYECLDGAATDGLTKRLESALKLFDENYRVYQYLFKRNNETIPHKLYGSPVVDAAIQNRIAYLGSRADTLFSLSIYYVILYQATRISSTLGRTLANIPKNPRKAFADLCSHFLSKEKVLLLGHGLDSAAAAEGPELPLAGQRLLAGTYSWQTGSFPRPQENSQLRSCETGACETPTRHFPRLLPK
jgi:type IV secretion system protein VirB4